MANQLLTSLAAEFESFAKNMNAQMERIAIQTSSPALASVANPIVEFHEESRLVVRRKYPYVIDDGYLKMAVQGWWALSLGHCGPPLLQRVLDNEGVYRVKYLVSIGQSGVHAADHTISRRVATNTFAGVRVYDYRETALSL